MNRGRRGQMKVREGQDNSTDVQVQVRDIHLDALLMHFCAAARDDDGFRYTKTTLDDE